MRWKKRNNKIKENKHLIAVKKNWEQTSGTLTGDTTIHHRWLQTAVMNHVVKGLIPQDYEIFFFFLQSYPVKNKCGGCVAAAAPFKMSACWLILDEAKIWQAHRSSWKEPRSVWASFIGGRQRLAALQETQRLSQVCEGCTFVRKMWESESVAAWAAHWSERWCGCCAAQVELIAHWQPFSLIKISNISMTLKAWACSTAVSLFVTFSFFPAFLFVT